VTNLDPSGGKWAVTYVERPGGTRRSSGGFDGVVITSTGPCARRFPKEPDPRVFDAVTFWQDLAMVAAAASASDDPVVIVGSGGTAAAAAGWLASANLKNPIAMIGTRPALYARTDSFFENALFRDGETWDQLSTEDRTQFTERLTRGAVWADVVDALAQSGRISYVPGRVSAVRHEPAGDPTGELVVEYAMSGDPSRRRLYPASVVVDAIGFDDSWFAELLPDALKKQVLKEPARMRSDMSRSLELPLTGGKHLHAPMLSQAMGPAYASLIALGLLSDAVLKPYVEAALT
jgi:mycobactin lysine-N-oxygenase